MPHREHSDTEAKLRTYSCSLVPWEEPRRLITSDGAAVVARYPSVEFDRGEILLAGNALATFDTAPSPEQMLTLWNSGRGMRTPKGSEKAAYPRVMRDANGLHLIWAEASPDHPVVPSLAWPPTPLTTVYASFLPDGGEWTQPRAIAHADRLAVSPSEVGPIARRSDGVSALPMLDRSAGFSEARPSVLVLANGEWKAHTLPYSGTVAAIAATFLSNNLYVALLHFSPDRRDSKAIVSLWNSADSGASWSSERVVARSSNSVSSLRLLSHASGVLHLLWLEEAEEDFAVQHFVIDMAHRGTAKSTSDTISFRPKGGFAAAMDSCGSLHFVFEDRKQSDPRLHLDYAVWNGTWNSQGHLFGGRRAASPFLAAGDAGDLSLLFLAPSDSLGDGRTVQTWFSARKR